MRVADKFLTRVADELQMLAKTFLFHRVAPRVAQTGSGFHTIHDSLQSGMREIFIRCRK